MQESMTMCHVIFLVKSKEKTNMYMLSVLLTFSTPTQSKHQNEATHIQSLYFHLIVNNQNNPPQTCAQSNGI